MKIVKRDGRKVDFDKFKIVDAVLAAFESVDGEISDYAEIKAGNIADYISDQAEKADHELTIEEIQDICEKGLMSTKRKDVAKAFIQYRDERSRERMSRTRLMKEVGKKIFASNVENQNANMDEHSFGGRRGEAANTMMKEYALNYCMSPMARENHLNNEIYIHDLDSYAVGMHNCLSIPFDDLLQNGFDTRQTDIRPANSIGTAFQLVAVIFQLQSLQQFGGVSATHLDWTMVPYVRKSFYKHFIDGLNYINEIIYEEGYKEDVNSKINDKLNIDSKNYSDYPQTYEYAMNMTEKELQQAVEGMYHNLSNWAA